MQGLLAPAGRNSPRRRGRQLAPYGDIAAGDSDLYLRIVDRLKEMIISMGENIYPGKSKSCSTNTLISARLLSSACRQAPEHVGCCYYTVEPGAAVDKRALKKYLQQNLALFKVPRIYYEIDEMPLPPQREITKRTGTAVCQQTILVSGNIKRP